MGKRIIEETLDQALAPGDMVLVDSSTEGARKFDLGTELTTLKSDLGDLSELETEDKSSLVAAINEAASSGGNGSYIDTTNEELVIGSSALSTIESQLASI